MTQPDAQEAITAAIATADEAFGYEVKLIRLVDGESTYSLRMVAHYSEHPSYDAATALVTQRRNTARAIAILAALRATLASAVVTDDLIELGLIGIRERDAQGWSDEDEDQINRELTRAVLTAALTGEAADHG
jgi:hypothetical protein